MSEEAAVEGLVLEPGSDDPDGPIGLVLQIDRKIWEQLGPRARTILAQVVPETMAYYVGKSLHYGDTTADELGPRAQFIDINRKVGPLKRRLWEGRPQEPGTETTEQILMDLIGHSLLTIEMMRRGVQ